MANEHVERFTPGAGQEWLQLYFDSMIALVTPFVKNKILLDAGCGTGYADNVWVKAGAAHIDAFDISDEAVSFASKNYKSKKISFKKRDLNSAVFKKNYYDICVSIEVLEHVENFEFHLNQLYQSLKKNGLLFLSTPNADCTDGRNEFHVKEFTYKEMRDLLKKNGFTVEKELGFNNNALSSAAGGLLPVWFKSLIKMVPIYSLLVQRLAKPAKNKPQDSLGMFFICKK
jgi:2-polyprenyl-3-methyl-5-hydroxy-6-metoxy-1,4-benzoquinol methylase